jgi:hypothetical protein
VDWHTVDPAALFTSVREQTNPADGERMVWAFEQVFSAARIDATLLDHLAAAALCGLAYRDDITPRAAAEQLFRRSVADETWKREYADLIDAGGV